MSRESILAEVSAERDRQDQMFGGASHDDTHSATDWGAIIIRHLGLAFDDGKPADVCLMNDHCAGYDPVRYRRQLVRVAAVAVAALEVFDRKCPPVEQVSVPRYPSLVLMTQRLADRNGQPALLITAQNPNRYGDGALLPYATLESIASPWERSNCDLRCEPADHVPVQGGEKTCD